MPFFTEAVAVARHDQKVFMRRRAWHVSDEFYVTSDGLLFTVGRNRASLTAADYLADDWTWRTSE